MSYIYAPRLTKQQLIQGTWGWTGGAWTPGLTFKAGPYSDRQTPPNNKDIFYDTGTSTLWQYQTNQWVNLNNPGNEVQTMQGNDPSNPSFNDLVNRYDLETIKQYTGNSSANPSRLAWHSMGNNREGLPTGELLNPMTGYTGLKFTDNDQSMSACFYLVLVSDDENTPLLAMDQGLCVKKDIYAGGIFMSSQGAVMLGHGLNSSSDPPKIILSDSAAGFPQLYIYQANGQYGDIRVRTAVTESTILNGRTSDPSSPANGEMWFRSDL